MASDAELHQLWNLIAKANDKTRKEEYSAALALTQEAETIIHIAEGAELADWRNLFEIKLAALSGLGRKEEMLAVCRQIEEQFGQTKTWQRSSDAYAIRALLRMAYSRQAAGVAEKATTLVALQKAISSIEACFSHIPRSEKDEAKAFYELRALIYRKAAQYDTAQYEPIYLSALSQIAQHKIPVADPDVKTDLQHPAFADLLKGKALNDLAETPAKETCKQAEKRWIKAYKTLSDVDAEYITPIKAYGPITQEAITTAEAAYLIPESLKKLYRSTGNGFGNEWNGWGFHFYRINEFKPLLDNLLIQWRDLPTPTRQDAEHWYTNQLKRFTAEEVGFINEHYLVFGSYWFKGEWPCYLFYGKNGRFGALIFNQDEWKLERLAGQDFFLLRYATIDELLARLVTVVINSRILHVKGWGIYEEDAWVLLDKAAPPKAR